MSGVELADAGAAAQEFEPARREAELLASCDDLVERSQQGGVDGTEAYGSYAESVEVRCEKGELHLAKVDRGRTLGLRALDAGRFGFASSNQTAPADLERLTVDARDLARASLADPFNRLDEPRALPAALDLVDPGLAAFDVEATVGLARDFFDRVQEADPRVSLSVGELGLHRCVRAIRTSTGIAASESDVVLQLSAFGMAVDGEDVGGFESRVEVERRLARVPAAAEELAQGFVEAILGNLGAGASESYRGPVLFTPTAFLSVLISPLVGGCSAIAVQRGRSALAERLGEAVADAGLTVRDDPFDLELGGAAAFDREGAPCGPLDLVRDGVLQGWLYNGYAAAREGRSSTGHAGGGARSAPSLGTHAIRVEPGTGGDLEALTAALGRGLLVGRFSGTVEPASGDFSGVAKSARWVEGGRVVRSVRETLIAGNAFELLAGSLVLGSTSERVNGSSRVPAALVDGVAVTAG